MDSRRNLVFFAFSLLISSFLIGAGCAYDYLSYRPERLFTSFGIIMPFGMLAFYQTYLMLFNLGLFSFTDSNALKTFTVLNLIVLFPGWIWQLSRAAWVSVSSLGVFLLSFKRRVIFISIFIMLLLIIINTIPQVKKRVVQMPNPMGGGWGDRVPELEDGVRIFHDYPLFGAGLGMYEKLTYTYLLKFPHVSGNAPPYIHCHNTYLEILSEMGMVGLAAFIYIFIVFGKGVYRFYKKYAKEKPDFSRSVFYGLVSSIAGLMVFAFAGSIITVGINESCMIWFLMGMSTGIMEGKTYG
jgi:O-antigen ligase